MEDPDSTGQGPSPDIQERVKAGFKERVQTDIQTDVQIKSSAKLRKLPLPKQGANDALGSGIDLNKEPSAGLNKKSPSADLNKKSPSADLNKKPLAGFNKQLWYALHLPQLAELPESKQKKHLKQLAALLQDVSSTVSFHPQTLICEIRSSLKYFAGIENIHQRLTKPVSAQLAKWGLPQQFSHAASPTVSGSLLLARAGHNTLVYQSENLRSALGKLSVEVLDLNKEQRRRLYNMGARYLSDIWRLPASGLRKRFGSSFVDQLNKALGKAPEPTHNYVPPPAFTTSYDLPYELENLDRLLPVADELIAQLCDFLRQRDLSTSHVVFSLFHEKRSATEVNLGLRLASRNREHLMLLLETHFHSLLIPAPVISMKLEVKKFDAFFSQSESLLVEDRSVENNVPTANSKLKNINALNKFIDQLQARLGDTQLKNIRSVEEHCPEYASQHENYSEDNSTRVTTQTATNPRPLWLLKKPLQLRVSKGRLYHRSNISILSGPERIESRWWSGQDVRRDYYVAQEKNGSRLWIYRERQGDRNWFLHGLFS